MTKSRGIGRGGLRNPPGGRPKGSIDRKARAEILEAERQGKLLPLDYMLRVLRDEKADERRRDFMAVASAPFLHAKLSSMKLSLYDPDRMTDEQMAQVIADNERALAALPDAQRAASFDGDLHRAAEGAQRLSRDWQRRLYSKMTELGAAGLAELNEGGAVMQPRPLLRRPGVSPNGHGEPQFEYDPATKKLRPLP